ncbi:MAG: ABC transporter permease [Planctomycetota bacterium]
MASYIVRRLLLMIPTLLGIVAVVFFVMALSPGGFAAVQLDEGNQTAGEDARRIIQQQKRRYGLDLPIPVQFARWLNRVSPVGFTMSDAHAARLRADEALLNELAEPFEPLAFATRDRKRTAAAELAIEIAAYTGRPPDAVAAELAQALQSPDDAFAFFDRVDAELLNEQTLRDQLAERVADGRLGAAQDLFLRELAVETSGRSRFMWTRPTIKWPDLGQSLRGVPVIDRVLAALPITVMLNAIAIPIIYLVAVVVGVYAARHRGGPFDTISGGLFLALWSFPMILAGVMFIGYLANVEYLKWFPTGGLSTLDAASMPFLPRWNEDGFVRGYLLDRVWHLVLPVTCLVYGGFAVMSKVMRGAVLDALSADYVRTARAKGVSDSVVLWQHAFRNSLLPLITILAGVLPALFAGSVVVETIFSINGLGKLGVEAAFQKDPELVLGTTLMAAILGLTAQLVRDLAYAVADPRVSYD